jgi:hypothetical protein
MVIDTDIEVYRYMTVDMDGYIDIKCRFDLHVGPKMEEKKISIL